MGAGTEWLAWTWTVLMNAIKIVARRAFCFDRITLEDTGPSQFMTEALALLMGPILSLGLLVLLSTAASQLAFGEGRFVPVNVAPKASRIDPLSGLGLMFGMKGLIELAKGLLKLALLGTITFETGRAHVSTPVTNESIVIWLKHEKKK